MIVSGLIVLRRVAILRVRLNTKNVKNNRFWVKNCWGWYYWRGILDVVWSIWSIWRLSVMLKRGGCIQSWGAYMCSILLDCWISIRRRARRSPRKRKHLRKRRLKNHLKSLPKKKRRPLPHNLASTTSKPLVKTSTSRSFATACASSWPPPCFTSLFQSFNSSSQSRFT